MLRWSRLSQTGITVLHLLFERPSLNTAGRATNFIDAGDITATVRSEKLALGTVAQQRLTQILQRTGAGLLILLGQGLDQGLLRLLEPVGFAIIFFAKDTLTLVPPPVRLEVYSFIGRTVSSAIFTAKSVAESQSSLPMNAAASGMASLHFLIRGKYLFLFVG